jgi:hypothetical protein
MIAYGLLLVTVMGSYIHSISPLPEIFYQRQVMCCNIHGPENIALTLKYVMSLPRQTKLNSFHSSVR